ISTSQTLTDPTISISSDSYASFEIIRTVTQQDFCFDSDTMTVRFTELPIVNLGADQTVCDSITMVNFTPPVGELNWQLSPNLVADITVVSPQELSGIYGNHQAILHADNGYGCIDSDTLNLNFIV